MTVITNCSRTDRQTDRRTDGQTEGQTNNSKLKRKESFDLKKVKLFVRYWKRKKLISLI